NEIYQNGLKFSAHASEYVAKLVGRRIPKAAVSFRRNFLARSSMRLRLSVFLLAAILPACFGLSDVEARLSPVASSAPVISLRYDGALRDRVGPNNLTSNPDGH